MLLDHIWSISRSDLACQIALDATTSVAIEQNGHREIDIKRYAKVEKVNCYKLNILFDIEINVTNR